jgi:hypothetical protein
MRGGCQKSLVSRVGQVNCQGAIIQISHHSEWYQRYQDEGDHHFGAQAEK